MIGWRFGRRITFKSHQTRLEHREMLRLLIEEIESAKQNIDLYPQLSSYRTLETVQKAKERWGADTADVGDWFGFGKSAAALKKSCGKSNCW